MFWDRTGKTMNFTTEREARQPAFLFCCPDKERGLCYGKNNGKSNKKSSKCKKQNI